MLAWNHLQKLPFMGSRPRAASRGAIRRARRRRPPLPRRLRPRDRRTPTVPTTEPRGALSVWWRLCSQSHPSPNLNPSGKATAPCCSGVSRIIVRSPYILLNADSPNTLTNRKPNFFYGWVKSIRYNLSTSLCVFRV